MNRNERVLAILNGEIVSLEDAVRAGVTVQDADDAITLARLGLELSRADRGTWRELVDEFLRGISD